jgi:hypothetical protein
MSDFIVIRHMTDNRGKIHVEMTKKSSVDLTEYKMVQVRDNGMEEYVHVDEYDIYKKMYEKMEK